MNEDYALIIGINDYTPPQNNGLRPLKGAINDATHFYDWVKQKNGGNVPLNNCFLITSSPNPLQPIQDDIDTAITNIFTQIKNNGGKAKRLYFYFAGHGLGSIDCIEDTALCLAKWSDIRRNTALSSSAYKEGIRQFDLFEEIIFLVDCCRNPKINVKPMHPTFGLPVAGGSNTRLFLGYATHYQDQAFEIQVEGGEMRGVFTKVLIDGLNGSAIDRNGNITADSLRDYLIKQTPIEAKAQNYKQIPEIQHSFTSDIPLVTLVDVLNKNVCCKIVFRNSRNSCIELIDDSGIINTFDAGIQKNVVVNLKKGIYLLRDTNTDEKYPIQVSPASEVINVEF